MRQHEIEDRERDRMRQYEQTDQITTRIKLGNSVATIHEIIQTETAAEVVQEPTTKENQ